MSCIPGGRYFENCGAWALENLNLETYRQWALNNPAVVKDTETFLRGLSYLLTGYLKESVLLSEFVFTSAQLLSLVNRRIITRDFTCASDLSSRLEDFLRVLQGVEVFLELASLRLGGPLVRWSLIFSVQVLRTGIRLLLLYRSRQLIRPLTLEENSPYNNLVQHQEDVNGNNYFTLKNSGRVIRKIQGAPSVHSRQWRPPVAEKQTTLNSTQMAGELIHVAQPLTHLLALGLFGEKSWAPLAVSLTMDCTSLGLHSTIDQSAEDRKELIRRWFGLLSYILRSPLYDEKSKNVILAFLTTLEGNLPFGNSLVSSLRAYLPVYQSIYFYTWSQE